MNKIKDENIKTPLVSIIIPVYNGANFLEQAIKSALKQDYDNLEILVVNDGSSDNDMTRNIALKFGNQIMYYEKKNGGVSSALNYGISKMNGDYFSWLSHDDLYDTSKITSQMKALLKLKEKKAVAYCSTRLIDKNNSSLGKKNISVPKINNILTPEEALKISLYESFDGCSLLVPKQAILEAGGFNERLKFVQDKEMWSKIAILGYSYVYVDETFVYSRLHSSQQTNQLINIRGREIQILYKNLYQKVLIDMNKEKRAIIKKWALINSLEIYDDLLNELNLSDKLEILIQRVLLRLRRKLSKVRRKVSD